MVKACEEYLKAELKLKANASERQFAEAQWSLLLQTALDAVLVHLKEGEDFKIGARNQKLEPQSYANMVAAAIERLHAQGDLMLRDMPDQQFLTTATHQLATNCRQRVCGNSRV